MRALAPAKINLFLHVGPPAADGFHPVCSLMVFADVGDDLALAAGEGLSLELQGPFASALSAEGDNLVLRAARAFFAAAALEPNARFVLTKALPVAAGVGGGSSDAGAALRLLNAALGRPLDPPTLQGLAAELGSDGPACLASRPVLGLGRGDQLHEAPRLPELHAVLVNPGVPCSTAAVYRRYDAFGPRAADRPELPAAFEDAEHVAQVLGACRNDLEAPAAALAPAVAEVLQILAGEPETLLARVSGSGATAFALCSGDMEAAGLSERISSLRPDWWVRPCRLGGPFADPP